MKNVKSQKVKKREQVLTLEQALKHALAAIEAGHLDEAEKIYLFLSKDRPRHPDVLSGKARLSWAQKKPEDALHLLEEAISVAKEFMPFHLLKGDWQAKLGAYDSALETWKHAFELNASLMDISNRLSVLDKADWSPWGQSICIRAQGAQLAQQQQWTEAVRYFKEGFALVVPEDVRFVEYKVAGAAALSAKLFVEAESWLLRAQAGLPQDVDVALNLGNVLQSQKKLKQAEAHYRTVLSLDPLMPEGHNNLGVVLKNTDRLDEAESHLREALRLRPDYSAAFNNLGLTLQLKKQLDEAESCLRQGLVLTPDDIDLNVNLAAVLNQAGRKNEAESYTRRASELAPNNPLVLCNFGVMAFEKKDYSTARDYYVQSMTVDPKWMPARCNLAALYMEVNDFQKAIEVCKAAIEIDLNYTDVWNNLGIAYRQSNRLGEAYESLERCLFLEPDHKEAMSNMAFVSQDRGFFDRALELYNRVLEISPHMKSAWDNYLFCSNYHPTLSQPEHLAIYRRYDATMGSCDKPINTLPRPLAGRKLRVAYLSGDLRKHPQQHFFMPFLDHHDRSRFEIWCYHEGVVEDAVSQEMRQKSDGWVRTRGMSGEEFARQVVIDEIDILVDLAGHTGGNRADVYPYRAAPVQLATLLGWNFGVGLSCMDALIGDHWTLPEHLEQFVIEPLLRVPCNTYVCRLDPDLPRIPELPAKKRGYLTFGTTTRSVRLNDRDLGLWAELLKAVPNSHLHFNSRNFKDPASINRMTEFFSERGVSAERLEFDFTSPIYHAFEMIDVYLDTFPHNNGTTLIEALWYGLPVITKVDRPPFGCIGQSILHHAGLADLIAVTEEEYIAIAQRLAADWDALERRRVEQRDRIAGTALFDEVTSVRWFEQAYIAMYEKKLEESGK